MINIRLTDNKLNVFTAFLLQIVAILSGFILSKLVLVTFGSDINGLISSINQFLSIISLLEGGLVAVVLSQLYKPIEERNYAKIFRIVNASNIFFRRIAIIFAVYCASLSFIYPVFIKHNFSFSFVSSLIMICGLAIFAQYFFSITNRILLQGSQKYFIINITMGISYLVNLLFTIILIKFYPQIHLLKLFNALLFFIQPVVYNYYVKRYYKKYQYVAQKDETLLKNRWSGFFQNLTYFIALNTDAIVLTIFSGLKEVSVYSVYMLVINSMRQLISSAAGGYQSAIGKAYVQNNPENLKKIFIRFYYIVGLVSVTLFCVTLLLIVPFVKIYTYGINDVNYVRMNFAVIMVLAQMLWCIREPYRLVVVSAGKFKETNKGAFIEAIINVSVSILLVGKFGLSGVAIGTLLSTAYQYFYLICYVNINLINIKIRNLFFINIIFGIEILAAVLSVYHFNFAFIDSIIEFIFAGILLVFVIFSIQFIIFFIINRWLMKSFD